MTMERTAAVEQVGGRSRKRRSPRFTGKLLMLSLAGATLLGGAVLVVPQFQDEASALYVPPPCPERKGFSCLAIDNRTANVHSIRSLDNNGQCIRNVLPGRRTDVQQVHVPVPGRVTIRAFTSNNCGGNDEVRVRIPSAITGRDGYALLTIEDVS